MTLKIQIATALTILGFGCSATASSTIKPDTINFDVPLIEARQQLQAVCTSITEQVITPAQIPDTRDRQLQLNCIGFDFKGQPRTAEFVYRDGELMFVWVLTTAEEEESLEAWMSASAKPSHTAREFTAFTSQNMALRKVPPEVLFYSDVVAPMFTAWFDSAVRQ